jgi:two-component system chemotaxis response regulator CheY
MSYNILVADDSATVRAMVAKTLGMAKIPLHELHQAKNGSEALAILAGHWIDLVLTDINMPEMDGMELVRRMSEDEVLSRVPVVVVSTEGSETRIEELRRHGIRGYIRKPFTPEEIKAVVEGILGGRDAG